MPTEMDSTLPSKFHLVRRESLASRVTPGHDLQERNGALNACRCTVPRFVAFTGPLSILARGCWSALRADASTAGVGERAKVERRQPSSPLHSDR